MQAKSRRLKKNKTSHLSHIPAWLVIVCGLAAMVLFAFATPMVVLGLQDRSQLSLTTQGIRDSVNVDFMNVEQLDIREKLRHVSLAEENGEQLYTITVSQTMTRDEQMTFLQNVRERNDEFISLLETILDKPLLETYDADMDTAVQYVVLDANADYLFSMYYLEFTDYEGSDVQLLADRDDYTIYAAWFDGLIGMTHWWNSKVADGYDPQHWAEEILGGTEGMASLLNDIYQTTSYSSTSFDSELGGAFSYESSENTGQEGERCLLYFKAELEFYETYDSYLEAEGETDPEERYSLMYGFPSVAELVDKAYGETLYDADTNADTNAETAY